MNDREWTWNAAMTIKSDDAMRELHAYAMEVMRNQGLEEAARVADDGYSMLATNIRRLKRDPAAKLSDWWCDHPTPGSP